MRGNYFIGCARAEVEKVGSKGSAGAGFWRDGRGEGGRSLLHSGFSSRYHGWYRYISRGSRAQCDSLVIMLRDSEGSTMEDEF